MEPTLVATIKSWPTMTEEEAKLLFIRKSASEAYAKGEIQEATKDILKLIVEVSIVNSMTKEEVGLHIKNLETARAFLASFTQGIQQGYANEVEPIFKAKREKEKKERVLAKTSGNSSDKKVNDLIKLAQSLAIDSSSGELVNTSKPIITVTKVKCDKCMKETFSLKYHKCN